MTTIKNFGKIIAAAFLMLAMSVAHAQSRFIKQGKIEYEKKMNMQKYIEDDSWTREIKDKMPTYRSSYFNLSFNDSVSVYKSGRELDVDPWKNWWNSGGSDENVIHDNFNTGVATASKQVFEKKFLVQDTMLQIEWRITDETREIAGFECRKAVGRFYDSLYVIAFYTEQIALPTGPELYNGLPGAILGLAFPRYYTTWFATKVELIEPKPTDLVAPVLKGKKTTITRKELMDQVKDVFQYGTPEQRQGYFWNTVL